MTWLTLEESRKHQEICEARPPSGGGYMFSMLVPQEPQTGSGPASASGSGCGGQNEVNSLEPAEAASERFEKCPFVEPDGCMFAANINTAPGLLFFSAGVFLGHGGGEGV